MNKDFKNGIKNRLVAILILLIILSIYFSFEVYGLKANCIIKSTFGFSCPACGLTRAFKSLLKFDIYSAFKYNILSIPIAIILSISIVDLIYDLIFGKDFFILNIKKFAYNYYILIILALVISFVYNNIAEI